LPSLPYRQKHSLSFIMKTFIALSLLALATALPQERSVIPILRSDIVTPDESGRYSVDFETGDGVARSESGVGSGANGAVENQGVISFTHPDGTPFQLQFVANALGGYQPQSDALPVAPAFPHPIPEFVLEQIRFGREQAANRPLDAARGDYVGYDQYSK